VTNDRNAIHANAKRRLRPVGNEIADGVSYHQRSCEGSFVPAGCFAFLGSKFQQIRPLKRGVAVGYYRPEDIPADRQHQDLLYNQGFTIRGAKLLKENSRFPSARSMYPIRKCQLR